MLKKLLIAGLTAGAMAFGVAGASAPANAFVYFGIGGPFYHPYHPHYGYWHARPHCGYVTVKKKWHGKWRWKTVWRCW